MRQPRSKFEQRYFHNYNSLIALKKYHNCITDIYVQYMTVFRLIIILVLPPGVVCSSNRTLPMPGTANGDAISHCQVMGRAGSVHHGADQ